MNADGLGPRIARRTLLGGGLAWLAPVRGQPGDLVGPLVPALPAPDLDLVLHDGRTSTLPRVLDGRITALQLMFTGCSATCPIQGVVFGALEYALRAHLEQAQLLSVSVDPLADYPAALDAWRRKFGAGSNWIAAAPAPGQVDTLRRFVGGSPALWGERHNVQTFVFDAKGRLSHRCAEFSSAPDIAAAMQRLSRAV